MADAAARGQWLGRRVLSGRDAAPEASVGRGGYVPPWRRRAAAAAVPGQAGRVELADSPDQPMLDWLVALMLVSALLPGTVYVPAGSLQITPLRALSMIAFMPLVLARSTRLGWRDVVCLSPFAVGFVSVVLSTSVPRALEVQGRLFLDGGVIYLAGRYVGSSMRRLTRVMGGIAWVLLVAAVVGLMEAATNYNPIAQLTRALGGHMAVTGEKRMGLHRVQSFTSHPIMYGMVNAAFLPLVAQAALFRQAWVGRWAWVKAAGVGAGVFMSLSSGAWVMAMFGVALVMYDRCTTWLPNRVRWPALFLGMPTLWTVLELASGRPLMRVLMMELHISSPLAWYYRWRLQERVMAVMPGYEWFGWGDEIPRAFSGSTGWSIDNHYLLVLMFNGWVGVTAFLAAVATAVFGCYRAMYANDDTPVSVAARGAAFAILAFAAGVYSVAMFAQAETAFFLIMGLAVSAGLLARASFGRAGGLA